MFVIMNRGRYVKNMRYGGSSSYTINPSQAQKFSSAEEAKKNACSDEYVVRL
jgi:hypothetical protein